MEVSKIAQNLFFSKATLPLLSESFKTVNDEKSLLMPAHFTTQGSHYNIADYRAIQS